MTYTLKLQIWFDICLWKMQSNNMAATRKSANSCNPFESKLI